MRELKVQTDPHKCKFGEWFDSIKPPKTRKKRIPALKTVVIRHRRNRIHNCMLRLSKFKKTFHQADTQLPEFLAEKEIDHLRWINQCQNAVY